MKEPIKKFDLEAAFKALDEIEAPKVKGIRPDVAYITEEVRRQPETDSLIEEYYDLSVQEDLEEAQDEREAEINKAKLARIEKIVDLDADSPEDLQPSYVGKTIVQCPQCMTLFYKDQADLVPDEQDPSTVNVGEPCQHCGNDSGYIVIGKVERVDDSELNNFVDADLPEENNEETPAEEPLPEEQPAEENNENNEEIPLPELPEDENKEEANESLNRSEAAPSEFESENKSDKLTLNEETVNEDVDKDLDKKLKEHNDYIDYLKNLISQDEEALKRAENQEVKDAIQRRLDSEKLDLENALPEAVKNNSNDLPTPEEAEVPAEPEVKEESLNKSEAAPSENETENGSENLTLNESLTESDDEIRKIIASWSFDEGLKEASDLDTLLDSDEFKKPVSDKEVKQCLQDDINIVKNDSPGRVDNRVINPAPESSDENVEEGLGLLGIGDVNVNLDASGQNNAVGVGGSTPKVESCEGEECKEGIGAGIGGALGGVGGAIAGNAIGGPIGGAIGAAVGGAAGGMIGDEIKEDACKDGEYEKPLEECGKNCDKQNEPLKEADEEPEEEPEEEQPEEPVEDEPVIPENSEEVSFTTEEVKEVATDVAQALSTPVKDEEEAEKQAEEIAEVVDEKVDAAIEEKVEETNEGEAEEEAKEDEAEEPDFNEDDIDDLDECSLNEHINNYLTEVYSNVKCFEATGCEFKDKKLIVEGKISFNSGKEKLTMFEFLPSYGEGKLFFEGYNKDLAEDKAFTLNCSINESKALITESFGYKYKINETLVEGLK